jgi:hypothetical protein
MMTSGASESARAERKTKVFISYSRSDMAFAGRLEAALKACGFEPLIDRAEIYAFEDWWKRIEALIVQADTIAFVLSPESVASRICQKEVDFAESLNKRFAPIVWRHVSPEATPVALSRLNWIFFDEAARFDEYMEQLAEALETNIGWIRKHTEFGELARRWDTAGRPGPSGLMLRPPILDEAEGWLAWRPHKAPEPTETTRAFVGASRAAFHEEELREQYRQAEVAHSQLNLLAQVGEAEHLRGNSDSALKLCVHATRQALESRERNFGPSRAPSTLAAVVSNSRCRLLIRGHEDTVWSAAFSPDGSRCHSVARQDRAYLGYNDRQGNHGPTRA